VCLKKIDGSKSYQNKRVTISERSGGRLREKRDVRKVLIFRCRICSFRYLFDIGLEFFPKNFIVRSNILLYFVEW
jgi:hypothetical protein